MKKASFALVIALVLQLCTFSVLADTISIVIDGKPQTYDTMPVIINDRVLVPMRGIFESLGATVEWDAATKTVTGTRNDTVVKLIIDNPNATVNGAAQTLDVPPTLVNDRTMVPIRFISEALGATVEWNGTTQTVNITSSAPAVESKIIFDDLTSFAEITDYIVGGGLSADKVSLSPDVDHTTGKGKSLKLSKREFTYERIKLLNILTEKDLGLKFTISVWVYLPGVEASIMVGGFGASGTAFGTSPSDKVSVTVPKAQWKEITFTYMHNDPLVTMLGIEQSAGSVAETMYIDDITISKKAAGPEPTEMPVGEYRPVPTSFNTGSSFDELVYYDDSLKPGGKIKTFDQLPAGKVSISENDFLSAAVSGAEYQENSIVQVTGMPFKKAMQVNVIKSPPAEYTAQISITPKGTFEAGDIVLVTFAMRCLDGGQVESGAGKIEAIVEHKTAYTKALKGSFQAGKDWKIAYLPFEVPGGVEKNMIAHIRVGFAVQRIEIGGYQMINYGKTLTLDEMPSMNDYSQILSDAAWRKDAIARIEDIRKGDMRVVVKDASGNAIPDADVKVEMKEHEFNFGSTLWPSLLAKSPAGAQLRQQTRTYFNGAVVGNELKWATYEKNPELSGQLVDWIGANGLKHARGHTLIWDRQYKEGITSMPADVVDILSNKKKLDARIKDHIFNECKDFAGQINDWDVLNEFTVNQVMATEHGWGMIKDWFTWAREAAPDTRLFINEYSLENPGSHYNNFKKILDYMVKNNIPFDGIGSQTHIGYYIDPAVFYSQLNDLSKYGKALQITEYDIALPDPNVRASLTRDLMLAALSCEAIDAFYIWTTADSGAQKIGALFDDTGKLSKSGEQYADLVYNKLWTRTNGKSGTDGTYGTRAVYGDYEITVSANGVSKTVKAKHYKGKTGVIEVVLQ